jgi:hypothetical protein
MDLEFGSELPKPKQEFDPEVWKTQEEWFALGLSVKIDRYGTEAPDGRRLFHATDVYDWQSEYKKPGGEFEQWLASGQPF